MIEHLSYSSISSYLSCAAAWKFHYIDQVPTPGVPELVFGSAFHNTIEQFIAGQHQGDLLQMWQGNWAAQLEKEQNIAWDSTTPEEMCNKGVLMFGNKDIQAGILSIKSERIETKVELRVPGVPVPIVGYIDVITSDGVPGDFKTSSKSWTMDKALGETQPLFYLAALSQLGITVPDWKFRHYVFVKTKTPQFQVLEHVHNPGQLFWLFKMIRNVWRAIDAGVFPENPTGWRCCPQYCDYWSICRGK